MITEGTWTYKGRLITELLDMPAGTFGFIYQITHRETNRRYIGKKVLYFERTKRLTKKELAEQTGKGRKPTTKKVVVESDWKDYYGSNKEFLETVRIFGRSEFDREILEFVPSRKLLTYYECKYLFKLGVIEPGSLYYNDNILGKFFRKDFQ
jgi:hypothetical protein